MLNRLTKQPTKEELIKKAMDELADAVLAVNQKFNELEELVDPNQTKKLLQDDTKIIRFDPSDESVLMTRFFYKNPEANHNAVLRHITYMVNFLSDGYHVQFSGPGFVRQDPKNGNPQYSKLTLRMPRGLIDFFLQGVLERLSMQFAYDLVDNGGLKEITIK